MSKDPSHPLKGDFGTLRSDDQALSGKRFFVLGYLSEIADFDLSVLSAFQARQPKRAERFRVTHGKLVGTDRLVFGTLDLMPCIVEDRDIIEMDDSD